MSLATKVRTALRQRLGWTPGNVLADAVDGNTAFQASLAAVTNGNGASLVGVEDAGGLTANATVEAVLAEILQHIKSAQKTIPVPLTAITQEDGTVLAKLAATESGWSQLSDKEVVLAIPVNATIEAFQFTVPVPQDLDDSADVNIHVLVGKDADNDTLTLDCEVYPVAAADGGNTDIQADDAAAITAAISELVFNCPAAGVLAAPGSLTAVLTLGGTNDGDAVYIYAVWIEYTGKALTS